MEPKGKGGGLLLRGSLSDSSEKDGGQSKDKDQQDSIGLLGPDLRSLQPLSENNLDNINTIEAYELETALDFEMRNYATKRNPQQSSILQEFS